MSDKSNLEKFLHSFISGEKEAAAEYLSQVITSKTRKLVNEGEKSSPKGSVNNKQEPVQAVGAGKSGKSGEAPTGEGEMDKSKVPVKDGSVGDTKEKPYKKVTAPHGKLGTTKEV